MPSNKLILKNPRTDLLKEAPIGFSWTILFFDFFVPLYRKDFLWAFVMILCDAVSFGLSTFYFAFAYNRIYAQSLFKKGFVLYQIQGDVPQKYIRFLQKPAQKSGKRS